MDWDDGGATEDVYAVLMDLLDGGRRKEVVWMASEPFHSFADYAELEKTRAQYLEIFNEAVREISLSYGQPRFLGERSRPDFPSWSDAAHLAIWAEDDDLACYLALAQARRDDPIQIRAGVR